MIWIAALLLLTLACGCTYVRITGENNIVEVRDATVLVESDIAKGDDNSETKNETEIDK